MRIERLRQTPHSAKGLFELPTSIKLTSIYGKSFETLVQELRLPFFHPF